MYQGGSWIVEIHNDHINTSTGVMLVFEELLGLSVESAHQAVSDVHHHGRVDLAPMPLAEAERLAAAFQIRGLSAKLREARRA